MANIEGSIFQGQIGSAHRELGSNAVVVEVLERISSSNSIIIYGKENASAGSDDLQVIGHIIAAFATPQADDDDRTDAALTSTTTTNDTLTFTCGQDVVYSIVVFGYPGKA